MGTGHLLKTFDPESMSMNPSTRQKALQICIILLSLIALRGLVWESYKLTLGQRVFDATDLKNFHEQTTAWVAREDVYSKLDGADYPPASFPLMYPLYVLDNPINRWIWFGHAIVMLGLIVWMCVRESGAQTRLERICIGLLPLAMFPTGVALGDGQLALPAFTATMAAVLLLYASQGRWPIELAAAACMLFALIKPNLSPPFFWIFLLVPKRKWPAIAVIVAYVLLTLLGASRLPTSLMEQFRAFLSRGTTVAEFEGYGDVPLWLGKAGHINLIMPFTLAALAAMGAWVWANRRADRWLLMGALAIMARFWAYHRLYDDMLNLFALVALLRLARGIGGNGQPDRLAWIVFLIAMTTIPGPATPLEFWRPWISFILCGYQTSVRLLMLAVIMHRTWMQRNQAQEQIGEIPLLVAQ